MQMRCPKSSTPPPLHTPADFAVCWEQCEMTRRRGPMRQARGGGGGGEVDEGTEQTDMRRDKHMNNEAAKPPLAVRFSGPPPFSLPSFSPRYRHPPHSPPSCLSLTLPPSVVPTPPPPFFFFLLPRPFHRCCSPQLARSPVDPTPPSEKKKKQNKPTML